MSEENHDSCLDCDSGRTMGCRTYCCQLLVRLTDEDMQRLSPGNTSGRFIEKDSDGYCVNLDRENGRCRIWEKRPEVCRRFNCNQDFMLQVAVTEGFTSIAHLALRAQKAYLPQHLWIQIPRLATQEE